MFSSSRSSVSKNKEPELGLNTVLGRGNLSSLFSLGKNGQMGMGLATLTTFSHKTEVKRWLCYGLDYCVLHWPTWCEYKSS
jgi:hypothetical protein